MDKITALCKRRGFIYPGSEIYGGIAGFWDYGPLGVELKNNIKREWWREMVQKRSDVVGMDAAIIMNPRVWETSGHVKSFADPLVECKICHQRFRADQEEVIMGHEGDHRGNKGDKGGKEIWTEAKKFNLLTEVFLGVTEPKGRAYLRGEITQGVFVNFKNVLNSTRVKIPFGIAQIGKAFRNEITPGNFTFRSREFEQMELEYFVKPDEKESRDVFEEWKMRRLKWYLDLGIKKENLRFRKHEDPERAHYARFAEDIEYNSPFGWKEFEGIHHRGDFDLTNHHLQYKDEASGEEYIPFVIETSGGVDRAALFFLIDGYFEEEKRVVLKLHPKIAPLKMAVFPLLANKPDLVSLAQKIYLELQINFRCAFDDRGNIGKRYLAQDEVGTPWCLTIDFQSLDDQTVTIRDRDTTSQIRIGIDKLPNYFQNKLP